MKKIILLLLTGMFLISFVSANYLNIQPTTFSKWDTQFTGNESVLYNLLTISTYEICIVPKDKDLKQITKEECVCLDKEISLEGECKNEVCEVKKYNYPKEIKLYGNKNYDVVLSNKLIEKNKNICFNLNPLESLLYKIGEESIIISAETGYDSSDINITQENKFAHLNLTDGSLVLYMPFDVVEDSANKTYDYTNNSNDGTLGNGSAFTIPTFNSSGGVYGSGAYKFDGVNDYVSIFEQSQSLNYTKNISFSAWIKPLSFPSYSGVLSRSTTTAWFTTQYGLWTQSSNVQCVRGNGTNTEEARAVISSSTGVSVNTWVHVTCVINDTDILIYTNGVYRAKDTLGAGVGYYSPTLWVGFHGSAGQGPFNGSIDEVMIFNRSLSQTEIGQIYNSSYSRFFPTGEMLFENLNFGTNNTVNISMPSCQTLNGSKLYGKVNDGEFVEFSDCEILNYNLSGSVQDLTIKFDSNDYNFYSPLVIGNITLESWGVSYTYEIYIKTLMQNGTIIAGANVTMININNTFTELTDSNGIATLNLGNSYYTDKTNLSITKTGFKSYILDNTIYSTQVNWTIALEEQPEWNYSQSLAWFVLNLTDTTTLKLSDNGNLAIAGLLFENTNSPPPSAKIVWKIKDLLWLDDFGNLYIKGVISIFS